MPTTPSGGLNFVDARDAAKRFLNALDKGRHGETIFARRGKLEFFGIFRTARKIIRRFRADARVPKQVAVWGANFVDSFIKVSINRRRLKRRSRDGLNISGILIRVKPKKN
jgi:dihydroflavonol-4-reductase